MYLMNLGVTLVPFQSFRAGGGCLFAAFWLLRKDPGAAGTQRSLCPGQQGKRFLRIRTNYTKKNVKKQ